MNDWDWVGVILVSALVLGFALGIGALIMIYYQDQDKVAYCSQKEMDFVRLRSEGIICLTKDGRLHKVPR